MTTSGPSILLAYFSRPGEHYRKGAPVDQPLGNTETLVGLICAHLDCDVYRILPADPYPYAYEDTVNRNLREQEEDARPSIADRLPDVADHEVVILASPVWNLRPPMIMATFTQALDLADKVVFPVTTHSMSGLGTAEHDYAVWCPGAFFGEGLAVDGEQVAGAGPAVSAWLERIALG